MDITFLGAAGTVTGSRFLVHHKLPSKSGGKILVDCGLFQGLKEFRLRNWAPFPVDPHDIDAIVLTHAHIDHSGYVPALVRKGYAGPVHCTAATADLLRILWPDAAYLQEEEAAYANRHGTTRHRPALPLYTSKDAQRSLELLVAHPFDTPFDLPAASLSATLVRAGHILGAASVILRSDDRTIAFTGDVGRPNDPVMKAPPPLPAVDVLVCESTYGNRNHARATDGGNTADALAAVINRTVKRGGVVLIPAFAVGRSQLLLHLLAELRSANRIPDVPVFLDSPMAINATEVFRKHADDLRLTSDAVDRLFELVTYARTPDQSKAIDRRDPPMIIIAASGMATGGRVLHHLTHFAPDPRNTVILTGFQAAGTRGEALANGADQLKIFGRYIPIGCEVARIDGLSAHADESELLAWLARGKKAPRHTWLVHGEPSALDALRRRIRDDLGWDVHIAKDGATVPV